MKPLFSAPPTSPSTVSPGSRTQRASTGERVVAFVLGLLALAVLITASVIRPDPSGVGTHQQLGLPPCGWVLASGGYPCPTCGMTTAFAAAASANPGAALWAQPFGAALALLTAVFFWGAMHVAVTGSMLARTLDPLLKPRTLVMLSAFFLAAWAYKALQMKGSIAGD